jgi:hypothetical protein
MAQKRMFDKGIVDTEKFIDMPISSKALYFLLGMEADDEGFVSAKKIAALHGTTDDDLKILLAKGYCIRFQSGIVVITDWKKNNWLDTRRIRRTEYLAERGMLLTVDGRYVLSTGLARGEERSIEERSSSPKKHEEEPELSDQDKNKRLAAVRQKLSAKGILS